MAYKAQIMFGIFTGRSVGNLQAGPNDQRWHIVIMVALTVVNIAVKALLVMD